MFSISPKMFPLCVMLAIGPPAAVIAINYNAWFAPKPIYPWTAQGQILAFETPWCGVCKAMKPVVRQLQDEGFDIRTIDADKHQEQAMKYGIGAVPTFVLVRDGEEVRRISGYMSPEDLKQIWR
jgi:thiol-disulfide isomerase/thioredoxin